MAPQMLISGCKIVCFLAGLSCITTVSLAACLHHVVKTIILKFQVVYYDTVY